MRQLLKNLYLKIKSSINSDTSTLCNFSKCEYNKYTDSLNFSGWVLSVNKLHKIKIYQEDRFIKTALLNQPRPDLYNKYPQYRNKAAGWSLEIPNANYLFKEDSTFVAEIHFDNETIQISKTMSIFDKYQLRSWSNLQDKANRRTNTKSATVSETSKCRASLAKYCHGDGLDIGFGGDPIVPYAISMDLPVAYAKYQNNTQHLHGDARNLEWFKDESLDFIYSSHVLEDFVDTKAVFEEWLRVLRIGGVMILFLPDEQVYRQYCKKHNKPPNPYHIHENFGLNYFKKLIENYTNIKVIHEKYPVGEYSFEIVIEKIGK